MQTSTKEKLASQLRLLARKVARAKARQSAAPLREAHGIVRMMQHISDTALTPHEQQRYSDIIMGLEQAIKALPTGNQPSELAAICQLLDEIIAYTQKMLASERTKKLVMFLPYKASMWDSLESVWQAASKDENIETIVMPIPYADRNPDGTCAEWHYELHEYPEYVPVVDCRTIDLPSLHPDVIFFHNPYDNCNAVTSVDSAYYSDQLKRCCDLLVYIPYFVTGHTIAPHFCQAPGVVNADKVIVENEDIKAAYEANYPGGNPPKDKFLALGSPKYDAVLSRKREDYVLPEKWQKIVAGKKIVLYNTSLSAMLENSQYVCRKLRYVFSIFKDRKDAALWWRPHPLMKSTMRSMRPEILAEYEAIEQEYIKEGWGIYDDTPDMDRAIVCSDCYYGDQSSMVCLYQETGKAIIIQDYRLNRNMPDQRIAVWSMAFCADGDDLWLVYGSTSLLFRYSIASKQLDFIGGLPGEALFSDSLYRECIAYQGRIFLIPCRGKSIHCYDTNDEQFHTLSYPEDYRMKGAYQFSSAVPIGKYIFCISSFGCSSLRIDMETLQTELVMDVKNAELDEYGLTNANCINYVTQLDDTKIASIYTGTNILYIYDVMTKIIEFHRIGSAGVKFSTVCSMGEKIYLHENDEQKALWTGEWKSLENIQRLRPNEYQSIRSISSQYMMMDDANSMKWQLVDNDMHVKYSSPGRKRGYIVWANMYHSTKLKDAGCYFYGFDSGSAELLLFDKKKKELEKRKIMLSSRFLSETAVRLTNGNAIVPEYPEMDFVKYSTEKGRKSYDAQSGANIIQVIK